MAISAKKTAAKRRGWSADGLRRRSALAATVLCCMLGLLLGAVLNPLPESEPVHILTINPSPKPVTETEVNSPPSFNRLPLEALPPELLNLPLPDEVKPRNPDSGIKVMDMQGKTLAPLTPEAQQLIDERTPVNTPEGIPGGGIKILRLSPQGNDSTVLPKVTSPAMRPIRLIGGSE